TENAANWVSKYGSVTFSQIGREFPAGGMNEAGLTAEILQMPETVYVAEDDPRPALNESQWVQFQLDNFATLGEVINSFDKLRVEQAFLGAHYFVCDRAGACGVFEFMNGKLVVHAGSNLELPVLTNNFYSESLSTIRGLPVAQEIFESAKTAKAKMSPVFAFFANTARSIARFEIAVRQLDSRMPAALIPAKDFAFDVLKKVEVARILRTQWSLVYDLDAREIGFRTGSHEQIKTISLAGLDFSCATPVQMIDMKQSEPGDISARLAAYTNEANKDLVDENWMILPKDLRKQAAEYPEKNTSCVQP
ncbi:MAG: linear amide C-N hydrolase, partial [Bdellovibrionota bacterium]